MCLLKSVHVRRFPSLHARFVINERSYRIILIAVFFNEDEWVCVEGRNVREGCGTMEEYEGFVLPS